MRSIGSGLLFAAAAVGVSHLVQSTRAGATHGLGLVLLVILANVAKYPAFRFGPQYAAATGRSLLAGYRAQGRWALVLYAALTAGTMFTVQAGVTVVTAGLAIAVFGAGDAVTVSGLLLLCCGALLVGGGFRALEIVVRALVAVLTISTLCATALVLPEVDLSTAFALPDLGTKDLVFMAALFGWMPSAIDVAVWQSLWTLEQKPASVRSAVFDFHVGYIGTASLALCFLLMGAGAVHGRGVELPDSAAGFAAAVVDMYGRVLGAWTKPVVGTAALAVMFSTTLTVLDGFPRAISSLADTAIARPAGRWVYWVAVAGLSVGALAIISAFLGSLRALIDVATTLSFLTAPVLSWLNHRAVHREPAAAPAPWLTTFSWTAIVAQAVFAVAFLLLRL